MVAGVDPRAACIIGVAQRTWHLSGDDEAPEPLVMAGEVARSAAADAGGRGDVLAAVDRLDVVHCMSWPYDDLPGRIAGQVGIEPGRSAYSAMGGTSPQRMLSAAAEAIGRGELDVAMVVGAEALDTKRRLKRAGERPAWSHRAPTRPPFELDVHPAEITHEVFQAWLTFALRDVARRARLGVAPDAYRRRLGELMAPMTVVAAANPHAWFPTARSVDDLVTPTSANRMVGYPYTRNMVAIMDVDMAAGVIMASDEAADRLGVPPERRVYLRGHSAGRDATYVAEHPDLWRSPAMARALPGALRDAGADIDDVAHLDLYSCFGASLHFACDALGIDPLGIDGSGRSLTVTGGLPYAGGPGSNYLAHAVATMVEALRRDPGSFGMVTGVGMHMTDHVAAVYSTTPGTRVGASVVGEPPPERRPLAATWDGPATVASYSVVHDRDGAPVWGLVVVDVASGSSRAYGRVDDPDLLTDMEAAEWVGRAVTSRSGDDGVNRVVA